MCCVTSCERTWGIHWCIDMPAWLRVLILSAGFIHVVNEKECANLDRAYCGKFYLMQTFRGIYTFPSGKFFFTQLSKCAKLYQTVPTCAKAYKTRDIRTFYTVWHSLAHFGQLSIEDWLYFFTVKNLYCAKLCKNVSNCVKLRQTVQNCSKLCATVRNCARLCLVIQKNLIKLDNYR